MSNMMQVFKAEITRLAKKQAKAFSVSLSVEVRKLRKGQKALLQEIKALKKQIASGTQKKTVVKIDERQAEQARLSAGLIKKLRAKLDISQKDMAKLLGVSLASVALWESGKGKPTIANKAKIIALRGMGKREATDFLK